MLIVPLSVTHTAAPDKVLRTALNSFYNTVHVLQAMRFSEGISAGQCYCLDSLQYVFGFIALLFLFGDTCSIGVVACFSFIFWVFGGLLGFVGFCCGMAGFAVYDMLDAVANERRFYVVCMCGRLVVCSLPGWMICGGQTSHEPTGFKGIWSSPFRFDLFCFMIVFLLVAFCVFCLLLRLGVGFASRLYRRGFSRGSAFCRTCNVWNP